MPAPAGPSPRDPLRRLPHGKRLIGIGLPWTLLFLGLGLAEFRELRREALTIALARARDGFQRDVIYRLWASERGGVYVPFDAKTPPNPYLAHLPNREITGSDGKVYTLVNPTYMTRMVHELGAQTFGSRSHITSLRPLRPENAPDPWEAKALRAFEEGRREYWELIRQAEGSTFRYMGAFITTEGCLRCHASQGYKVGDVRGGISVSVPLETLQVPGISSRRGHLIGLALVWAGGLLILLIWTRRERRKPRSAC